MCRQKANYFAFTVSENKLNNRSLLSDLNIHLELRNVRDIGNRGRLELAASRTKNKQDLF